MKNWIITILGIIIVAIGTGILRIDKAYFILGSLIIAFGTVIMTIANRLFAKRDSEEIDKKIKGFSSEIQAVKENSVSDLENKKINEVENDFKGWAKKIVSEKDIISLKVKKRYLSKREDEIRLNNDFSYLYSNAITKIRELINAYNSESEDKLFFTIPDIPKNIFSEEFKDYIAQIKIADNVFWSIVFMDESYYDKDYSIPSISLSKDSEARSKSNALFHSSTMSTIRFNPSKKIYTLIEDYRTVFKKPYLINNFDKTFPDIIKNYFVYLLRYNEAKKLDFGKKV